MIRRKAAGLALSIAALALGTASCVGSPDAAADEDVAVAAEALGGFTELVNVGNEPPLDIGPTYTVFRNQPTEASCGVADVVFTQTGAHVPVPALPGCANITTASSQAGVYVADQRGSQIYELRSTTSGGNTVYSWAALIATNHVTVTRITRASSIVQWLGSNHILHTFDLFPGQEIGSTTFNGDLLATSIGGSGLSSFGNFVASDGMYELRRVDWQSSPETVLARSATSFAQAWVSVDSTKVYWVEPSTPTTSNYLMSVPTAGGSSTIVKASMTVKYAAPQTGGSMLYWLEINVSDGSVQLRRKNLSNGVQMGVSFPFTWSDSAVNNRLKVLSDAIYFTPYFTSPVHWTLERTQL